jgi:hypothetical protein
LKTKVVVLAREPLASVIAGGDNYSMAITYFFDNASASLSQKDVSQQITALASKKLIHDILNNNDCNGLKEHMNISLIDQQLNCLKHLNDMHDNVVFSLYVPNY